jgi:hypothetical protein
MYRTTEVQSKGTRGHADFPRRTAEPGQTPPSRDLLISTGKGGQEPLLKGIGQECPVVSPGLLTQDRHFLLDLTPLDRPGAGSNGRHLNSLDIAPIKDL